MAYYTPDVEYLEAKKIIDKLGNSKKDQAIKYYIKKHHKWHEEDKEKLKRYGSFFETLSAFLPKTGRILG